MARICFVVTDSISFNILCRGQLEYFKSHYGGDAQFFFLCGGSSEQLEKLRSRNVGEVLDVGLVRNISFFTDLMCFIRITVFFISNRFDLIVFSTPKALLLASIASFFTLQKRRVAIVRGRVYENFTGLKKIAFLFLDKVSLALSSQVLFISSSLRDVYLRDKLVSSRKSFLLGCGSSNGVDLGRFNRASFDEQGLVELRGVLGFTVEDFIVCIVGRVCIDKGIQDVMSVVSTTSDNVKFLIVGAMEDDYAVSYLRKNNISPGRVVYLDRIENVERVFFISDVHLFLSHREGFGNVAIEAAAAGVPTFSYDVVGVKDSVIDGVTGRRFGFGNTSDIAFSINEAALDRRAFSSAYPDCRQWVSDRFDQRLVWENYSQFFFNYSEGEWK